MWKWQCAHCVCLLVSVSMNCWCLLEPSSAHKVIVWGNLVWGNANFEECFVALCMINVRYPLENSLERHSEDSYLCVQLCYLCWECPLVNVWYLGLVSKHWTPFTFSFVTYLLAAIFYFRLYLLLITSILLVFHYLFAELVHLYIWQMYGVCWGHKRLLVS
jgi:hypothetical protein